jgi:hypothetical protein
MAEQRRSILGSLWRLVKRAFSEAEAQTQPIQDVSGWALRPRAERTLYVMRALVEQYNFPITGAAGLVGNLYAESGLIPCRLEGSHVNTPMRTADMTGNLVDFTPQQAMNRIKDKQGPRLAGAGLAQWTFPSRRKRFFSQALGAAILFDMDAQLAFLVEELQTDFPTVYETLMNPNTTVEKACDEVVLKFERPADQSEKHLQVRRGYAKDAYLTLVRYQDNVITGKN